jgi:hypothetical protein
MQHDLAKTIRKGWRPEGKAAEAKEIVGQATRLERALKVAEKWMRAAREAGGASEMYAEAQYARDSIEEELSRVAFELAIQRNQSFYRTHSSSAEGDKNLNDAAPRETLAEMLLNTYGLLRELPAEVLPDESSRARYELMGALMVALDAANAKLEPREPEAKQTA